MRLAVAERNAQNDAITAHMNSGVLKIYDGTAARPADPDTAVPGTSVLLATLTLNATAAPASSSGILTLNAITSGTGTAGAGAGTAPAWARLFKSDGITPVADFSCGVGSGEINFAANISNGATVSIASMTITNPVGT